METNERQKKWEKVSGVFLSQTGAEFETGKKFVQPDS